MAKTTPLVIRRRADGSVTLEGKLPARHTFAARALARWLEMGLAEVAITIRPANGDPVVYQVTGFEAIEGTDRLNYTGWEAKRVKDQANG